MAAPVQIKLFVFIGGESTAFPSALRIRPWRVRGYLVLMWFFVSLAVDFEVVLRRK